VRQRSSLEFLPFSSIPRQETAGSSRSWSVSPPRSSVRKLFRPRRRKPSAGWSSDKALLAPPAIHRIGCGARRRSNEWSTRCKRGRTTRPAAPSAAPWAT